MRMLTISLAALTILLGLVIFVIGAVHGGTSGMVIGALFAAAGSGRLWLMRRRLG
ncbi:MAG TPA: hypothetical protein VGU02_01950 [Gaiellaceae bacterium]|nr:hypothetical protein [Gaiellaceae bacterium]